MNLDGPFLCTRAVLRRCLPRVGGDRQRRLGRGNLAFRDRAAYNSTKGGIIAFTRAVAAEHAADGIRCNAVAPASSRRR